MTHNLTADVQYSAYAVELTMQQYRRLNAHDYLSVVLPKLNKLGAHRVEYDGHFGARVMFNLDPSEYNLEKVVDAIHELATTEPTLTNELTCD